MNEFTRHVPGRIRRVIETGQYAPVPFTRFINTPDSPYPRLLDWHASAEPPEIDLVAEVARRARDGDVFDNMWTGRHARSAEPAAQT